MSDEPSIKLVLDKKGKLDHILCKCGNQRDFIKYSSFEVVLDERKRKKEVKKTGIQCLNKSCKAILTEQELNNQLFAGFTGSVKTLQKN